MATSARLEELQHKFNENPRRYFAPLANEHRKLGDLDQAITLCRTHLPQQPQHVSGHIVLAQALFEAGNTPDARQSFELALDLDPENLIALRFLGDIARTDGDRLTARQWYERVLDADPRNDEIARLIRDLENGAAAPAPAQAETAEPPAIESDATSAALEPNDTVEDAPLQAATAEPIEDLATAWQHEVAALDSVSTPELRVDEPFVEETPTHLAAIEPEREPEPEPVAESVASVAEVVETVEPAAEPNEPWAEPDEEFVASVPTVEMAVPPAPPPFAEIDYSMFEAVADEESVSDVAAAEPASASIEEETPAPSHGHGDDWFAFPGGREAEATAAEPIAEAAFDLDAAFQSVLPNNGEVSDESLAASDAADDLVGMPRSREWDVPEETAAADDSVFSAQLESSDSVDDAFAELDRMTASLEADIAGSSMLLPDDEYSADQPVEAPQHVDALIGRTPESGIQAVEQTPSAFVTETMAELYLQQGFRDEALAVYRQLLQMNPSDAVLEGRVRALEGSDDSAVTPRAEAESFDTYAAPQAHADAAGQSMRAFLGVFARRRAPMRRRARVTNEVVAVPQHPESGLAMQQPESRLAALFGAAQGTDDGAAAVLAGAFAQPNADFEALPGRPTRAAAEELSLGDVFGGGVATSGARAATFDEFFSTGNAEQSTAAPLDEEGSDMVQFTAWLEGLKKK